MAAVEWCNGLMRGGRGGGREGRSRGGRVVCMKRGGCVPECRVSSGASGPGIGARYSTRLGSMSAHEGEGDTFCRN